MDDLISREAAIAEIDEYLHGLDSCISEPDLKLDGYKNGLQVAIQELKALPAVDAAPVVHGWWKDRHVYGIDECTVDNLQSARCTNCGKYHTTPYMYYFDDFAYCPYCGARMDGERRDT